MTSTGNPGSSAPLSALDLADQVITSARRLGAHEASVSVSEGSSVEISRRDRRVEHASEASTRRLTLSLLVDDRYSSHSTSDLRPDALETFLQRAVAATRYLEADADRALPARELCGRGATDAQLDTFDPSYLSWTADDRAALAERLEQSVLARAGADFVSATAWVSDGSGRNAMVTSHGFSEVSEGAWFALGAAATLSEPGGRRPEGSASYSARYRSDLPDVERIAAETFERAQEAIGAGPAASGRYPMFLLNRSAGRILGALAEPLSGYSIHHGRSCLADRLDQRIGSDLLTILDDPTIPRGLGSEPWDDDLLIARPRTVVEAGILRMHYIDVYHGRKLGRPPTTSSKSNWLIQPGPTSWQELAKPLPRAILVTGFLGGNTNGLTGDFSLGIRGRLIEHGEPTASLSEMNITGNITSLFERLVALGDDPWRYSSMMVPTLMFDDVQFSGT